MQSFHIKEWNRYCRFLLKWKGDLKFLLTGQEASTLVLLLVHHTQHSEASMRSPASPSHQQCLWCYQLQGHCHVISAISQSAYFQTFPGPQMPLLMLSMAGCQSLLPPLYHQPKTCHDQKHSAIHNINKNDT